MSKLRFHLIPCSQHKTPLTKNGEKDASNDPEVLQAWRAQHPSCNVAIATGPSGLIAVDEDTYKAAYVAGALERLVGAELPPTVEWASARGGRVRIFRRPDGVTVPPKNGIIPGVDVKASAGYVLIPPSKNAEGQPYTWVRGPKDNAIADAPPELVRFCVEHKTPPGARPQRAVNGAQELYLRSGDGRWEFLRRLGGILRREGCGEAVLRAALSEFAEKQCEPDETVRPSEIDRMVSWLLTVPVGMDAQLEMLGRADAEAKNEEMVKIAWADGTKGSVRMAMLAEALEEGAWVDVDDEEDLV